MTINGITTFLWFDGQAKEAADFYASIFPGGKVGNVTYYQQDAQQPAGSVLVAEFEIFGQAFAALNGGAQFPHSEAVSFQMSCDTQDEIDLIWNAIVDNGGQESMCGWCKDRWGVSWQIVPAMLPSALGHPDPEKSKAAFAAMMTMHKLHIPTFEAIING